MEVMQMLADEHIRRFGESEERLKVSKRKMPVLLLASKLAKSLAKAQSRNLNSSWRAMQAAVCMPTENGKDYLGLLL